MDAILFDLGLVIVAATILAFIARLIKQPMILAFLLAGILIGPQGLKLVTDQNAIYSLSEIGIAFLLFIVGLELDVRKLRELGKPTLIVSSVQVILSFLAGFFIGKIFLSSTISSIYLGLAVSFASTTVVLKLLSEKGELHTVHGRFQTGILIVQDVFAVLALAFLTTLSSLDLTSVAITMGKGLILFASAFIAGRFIFPFLFGKAAKNQDLLFLTAISLSFIMAYFATKLEFSIAMGAFLAGISIASLPYSFEIVGKMKSLRDFFVTLFFVALGMQLGFSSGVFTTPFYLMLGVVLILTPLIIMLLISLLGYGRKISFLTGIGLCQVSEFALVITAQGLLLGHITKELASLIAIVTVITITISTYILKYDRQIFSFFEKRFSLSFLDRFKKQDVSDNLLKEKYDYVLIGYDRIGYSILHTLNKLQKSFVIIEYNPDTIKKLKAEKIPCIYGDIGDPEILEKVGVNEAKLIISTVPDKHENVQLIKNVRKENKKALVIVTARHIDDALHLYELGADYVIIPFFLGGDYVSFLLESFTGDFAKILYHKVEHINQLKKRKAAGHEVPLSN